MARYLRVLFSLTLLLALATGLASGARAAGTTFSNNSGITIPESGNGTPYPSVITVSGVSGTVTDVTVTLNGVNHTYGWDVAVYLTNPAGDSIWLMAQAGDGDAISNADLTFKADILGYPQLPEFSQIVSGTYSATDYGSTNPDLGSLFNSGQDPNGDWELRVSDLSAPDSGSIAGWSLTITTSAVVQQETALAVDNASGLVNGTVDLTATLTAGGNGVEGKSVDFTLNGTSVGSALSDSSGVATLADVSLSGIAAGSYPDGIVASFAGDDDYLASSGSADLTVSYGQMVLFDQTQPKNAGSTIPVKLQLLDANGVNLSAADVTLTALDIDGDATLLQTAGNANVDNVFRYDAGFGGYILNLKTKGLESGMHTLHFSVSGDPVTHSVTFMIK